MKRIPYIIIASVILASCGGGKSEKTTNKDSIGKADTSKKKITPVSVMEVQPQDFVGYVEVQSQIASDEM